MSETTNEILFYHLERQPLERVLPSLLEKTLERGWRAIVKAGSEERLEAVDLTLWTYRDESFLPHGRRSAGANELQPIYLTCEDDDVPNGAGVCFLIDGAQVDDFSAFERVVYLFNGQDEDAVTDARSEWTRAKDAGCAVTYWQQNEKGRWEKRA